MICRTIRSHFCVERFLFFDIRDCIENHERPEDHNDSQNNCQSLAHRSYVLVWTAALYASRKFCQSATSGWPSPYQCLSKLSVSPDMSGYRAGTLLTDRR